MKTKPFFYKCTAWTWRLRRLSTALLVVVAWVVFFTLLILPSQENIYLVDDHPSVGSRVVRRRKRKGQRVVRVCRGSDDKMHTCLVTEFIDRYLAQKPSIEVTERMASLSSAFNVTSYDTYCSDLRLDRVTQCRHPSGRMSAESKHRNFPMVYQWFARNLTANGSRRDDVSIVTQMSVERLEEMRDGMCVSWNGPISLAVLVRNESNWQSAVRSFVDGCPQIEALSVLFASANDWYPINHLRNVALQQSAADYVFLIDSDFVPCFGMYDTLRTPLYQRFLRAMLDNRNPKEQRALVVAALETPSTELLNRAKRERIPMAEMRKLFRKNAHNSHSDFDSDSVDSSATVLNSVMHLFNGLIGDSDTVVKNDTRDSQWPETNDSDIEFMRQFHAIKCRECHGPIDYEKWLQTELQMDGADFDNGRVANPQFVDGQLLGAEEFQNLSYTMALDRLVLEKRKKKSVGRRYPRVKNRNATKKSDKFEPYVIVRRRGLHRYDSRLVGYGKNKIVHIEYLTKCQKYAFQVLNGMFAVTSLHEPSAVSKEFRRKDSPLSSYLNEVFAHINHEMGTCMDGTGKII